MNKLIPDPFYGTNESKLQWIGKENWIYKTRFDVADNIFNKKHIELIFNGLDTYAEVRLNGRLILNADNMFRTWKVDCKKILRKKGNTLTILFRSPLKVNKARFERMPYRLPADNDRSAIKVSVFTRKASYQFGWDRAPRFVTSGIWRPIEITAWDNAKISDLQIYQQKVSDSLAVLKAVTEVRSGTVHSAVIQLFSNDSLLAENNLFFARTKDLVLPKPHLQYKTKTENGNFIVIITSKVFVKYVVLNYPDDKGIFSDNYFALLPGRSKTIRINLKNAENEFYKRIKIKSLY